LGFALCGGCAPLESLMHPRMQGLAKTAYFLVFIRKRLFARVNIA
jgi:hypothetical protein